MSNFPFNVEKNNPDTILNKGKTGKFFYTGTSMNPTFRLGHLLYIRPDVRDVKPGDVVVYERDGHNIVHRVVLVGKDGYVTRGDNNLFSDPKPVAFDKLIGRVEMGEHQGKIDPVLGGWHGLWIAQFRWIIKWIARWLRRLFGWAYRSLKASRLMKMIWKPEILRIQLKTETGLLIKYVYHKKTVAIWDPSLGRFACLKPFDLVILSPIEETNPTS